MLELPAALVWQPINGEIVAVDPAAAPRNLPQNFRSSTDCSGVFDAMMLAARRDGAAAGDEPSNAKLPRFNQMFVAAATRRRWYFVQWIW